jgi:hypothetical protein
MGCWGRLRRPQHPRFSPLADIEGSGEAWLSSYPPRAYLQFSRFVVQSRADGEKRSDSDLQRSDKLST